MRVLDLFGAAVRQLSSGEAPSKKRAAAFKEKQSRKEDGQAPPAAHTQCWFQLDTFCPANGQDKRYKFCARDDGEAGRWVRALQAAIDTEEKAQTWKHTLAGYLQEKPAPRHQGKRRWFTLRKCAYAPCAPCACARGPAPAPRPTSRSRVEWPGTCTQSACRAVMRGVCSATPESELLARDPSLHAACGAKHFLPSCGCWHESDLRGCGHNR